MKWIGDKPRVGLIFYQLGLNPQFQRIRNITCVNLAITTRCNRACPDCCCNVPQRKRHWDADVDYLKEVAKCFKGIARIQLTGGEPTLHPQIQELAPKLKELFNCRYLTIETNGFKFRQMPELFKHFDAVHATHYAPPEFEEDNGDDIRFLQEYLRTSNTTVHINRICHLPRARRAQFPCFRGFSGAISCFQGEIYPCCMGWGIESAQSVQITENWRRDLLRVPLPCPTCFFAEEGILQRIPQWRRRFIHRLSAKLLRREP
jgi:hypothetical protein